MASILMPKATAVWLIDNTSLSFDQIARFCALHALEVKGIADGDVAAGVRGLDPIGAGQLTRGEIEKAEADPGYDMQAVTPKHADKMVQKRRGPRYTPLSRRQERPDAIAWMIRNHPEVSDAQIGKLIGTTKTTIEAVRTRKHWNSSNIKPVDPVSLALCRQIDLDAVVAKASAKKRKMDEKAALERGEDLDTLRAAAEIVAETAAAEKAVADEDEKMRQMASKPVDAASVFGAFKEKPEEA
ncbi:MAG: hypothetical protein COA85_13960 [Robiginitomaculum sp.]|nr:MAG: hypothetical protein COA85_13960 [Robiginitomaculum sp.]